MVKTYPERAGRAAGHAEKKSFIKEYLGEKSLEVYSDIVEFMSKESENLISKDAWYLSIVGIAPQFQGAGLGVELVKSVLNDTDVHNIPTYLETFTRRNMSFYERLGYKDVGTFIEPVTNAEYWIMLRDPQ